LPHSRRADHVADQLRRATLDGALRPGSPITESQFAAGQRVHPGSARTAETLAAQAGATWQRCAVSRSGPHNSDGRGETDLTLTTVHTASDRRRRGHRWNSEQRQSRQ
jgi:hypothetical protein